VCCVYEHRGEDIYPGESLVSARWLAGYAYAPAPCLVPPEPVSAPCLASLANRVTSLSSEAEWQEGLAKTAFRISCLSHAGFLGTMVVGW
jgi:hypothetical protein